MNLRYCVIGGNPFRTYTGTGTFTGLNIKEKYETLEEANEAITEYWYDACDGLVLVLDLETGEEV